MRGQMRNEWLALVLASASAGAALLLCAIGIYGLLAQFVATHTRDIAVRLMLGASHRHAPPRVRVYDGFSFGNRIRHYPEMRGTLTDLLIGDLFHDRVDTVWAPLESLYEPDKQPIPAWDAGVPADEAPGKANDLILPDGRRP